MLLFYVISGYLIALVLDGPYAGRWRAFYVNRALRIFVPALVVALLIVVLVVATGGVLAPTRAPSWLVGAFSWITSFGLVGQDAAYLLASDPAGHIVWLPYPEPGSAMSLTAYQLNTPLFSVAIELYFYAIAPFVARSARRAIALVMVGALYHIVLKLTGHTTIGLAYHLFPSSWLYFGAGSVAFHLSRTTDPRIRTACYAAIAVVAVTVASATVVGSPIAVVCLMLGLPSAAQISRNLPFDRSIGNLSYLVYLVHLPILGHIPATLSAPMRFAICAVLSLLAAVALHVAVERPLDQLRARLREGRLARGQSVHERPALASAT